MRLADYLIYYLVVYPICLACIIVGYFSLRHSQNSLKQYYIEQAEEMKIRKMRYEEEMRSTLAKHYIYCKIHETNAYSVCLREDRLREIMQ